MNDAGREEGGDGRAYIVVCSGKLAQDVRLCRKKQKKENVGCNKLGYMLTNVTKLATLFPNAVP